MKEQLFDIDMLYFRPVRGEFDVARIEAKVLELGYTFRDLTEPHMFVVCPDEEGRQVFSASRKAHPEAGFPYVLLIEILPDQIYLNHFAGPIIFELSEQFIRWLTDTFECKLFDESDNDITALLADEQEQSTPS